MASDDDELVPSPPSSATAASRTARPPSSGRSSSAPAPRYLRRSSLSGYAPGDALERADEALLLPYLDDGPRTVDEMRASVHAGLIDALEPRDCAFVLRSDGSYTYALFEGRLPLPSNDDDDANNEGGALSFIVDERGCFKIISRGSCTKRRVRLPIIDTTNVDETYVRLTKSRYLTNNNNDDNDDVAEVAVDDGSVATKKLPGVATTTPTDLPHEGGETKKDDDDDNANEDDDANKSIDGGCHNSNIGSRSCASSNSSSTTSSSSSVEGGMTFSNSTTRRNDIIARTETISKSISAKDFDELLRGNSGRIANGNSNNNNNNNNNNNKSSSSSSNGNGNSNKQFSVLIVEDTDICAKFLTMQLTRMDCKTYRAENGRVAIDILQDYLSTTTTTTTKEASSSTTPTSFDMVLMDLRMPIMDGLEATRMIRNELKLYDLPIVALTGEMIDGCKEECKDVGFNDYFQKPIKKDKLELLINKYKKNNQEGGRDDATTTTNQGGNMVDGSSSSNNSASGMMMNNISPTLRRTTSSAGIVRTTSGRSVRELIRRHRSKQSMENMTNLLAQGDSEIANMILSRTNSTISVTNHDLVRPPPRRSTLDNNSSSNNNNTNNNNSSSQLLTLDTTMPLSILIVEDTDVCAKFLMMQLERMNCSTQRAENGQVAVDILRKALPGTFDLVLMDLRMPVMDGLDATRIIKSKLQLKELPVVALTGEMIDGCRAECAGIGFDDFFQKPMKKDKLETLINKYKSIRDGRSGGGHHHTEETTTNNGQAIGIMSMNNGGGTTRAGVLRSSRRSLNALNSSLFVPDSHRQNANFDDFLQMTTLRQSTTIAGKSHGGGQLHLAGRPRQLSIDQQLQDPNLKMFTKTIHSIGRSTSRESFHASHSNQQLGSTNSFVNQSAANATWESSQPIREASYISSSTQGSASTIMPRNITLQRIKENDNNLTQQTNGSDNALWGEDVSSTCHQLKHQPDLTSIMSKMVTSTGLGGNNMRVASVQDFSNTLTTQSGSAGSGRTGHSSNQMGRNVSSLQRIKEANVSLFDGNSNNTSWDNNATTPMNESSLLRMMSANGGVMSSSSSNPLLQMMAAREQQSQGKDAPSNSSSNSLLQMMAARKSQQ